MADVKVFPQDGTFIRIETSPALHRELSDFFSFEMPGARYMPSVRKGHWDGRIRLYKKGLLFAGLLDRLRQFCEVRSLVLEVGFEPTTYRLQSECSTPELLQRWDIPEEFTPRDYQIQALEEGIKNPRAVFLSATGSGKTLIIYLLSRYYEGAGKVLIIVPTTTLVHQGLEDFKKYGNDTTTIQGIVGGETREVTSPITFSTWQSIVREPKEWMEQFATVIVDEAHGAKSDSLQKILSSAVNAHFRFGFTATLSGAKTHEMILTGLLGPVIQVTSAKALMEAGVIARASIKMVILEHPKAAKKACPRKYQDEILYLINCDNRNTFLTNLALDLKGNTLVLYTRVAQHGNILYERIKKLAGGRGVHFVHGGIDGEDRNQIRKIVETADNDIIVASFGVFSQGIDSPRLHNIIFSSPYKSKIIVPQSIGRGLRLSDGKKECKIFDVVDDLIFGRRKNYAMKHSEARLRIYAEQGFDVSAVRVRLDYEILNRAEEGETPPCHFFT